MTDLNRERLNKELIFNVIVFSFLLSGIYGVLFTNLEYANARAHYLDSSMPGYTVVYMASFLVLYAVHVLVSGISFMVLRYVGNKISTKIIVFNIIGIVVIGTICFLFKYLMLSVILVSFVVFSVVSVINNRSKTTEV